MSAPPVEGTPIVVYCGPDSDDVVAVWQATDRPFDLRGFDADGESNGTDALAAFLDDRPVDCVVCHSQGDAATDVSRLVGLVRERDEQVPVVVLDGGGAFDPGAAIDLDVTQYLEVGDDVDPVEHLERLEPLVERFRIERRDRSMFDSLLRNIPLSVYFKDRTGRHVRASDALPSMVGPPYLEAPDGKRHYTPEDVVGKTDFDLYPTDLAEETVADDEQVVESGEPIEERIERSSGGELDGTYVATSKAPWYDDHGRVMGLVGVTRDITERQQYEKQLERQNERLERFASVISHDLRNPLEVAYGRLEFAEETGDAEHFEAAEQALDRINDLIDDLLTLARHGETVSDPQRIDLAAAAWESWSVVDAPDATLAVDTEATILADRGRLQQLFENVFRNAVEHAGDDVTVTVGDLTEERGFFVADDGPGVPDDVREDVFDSGFSTGTEGTGLGLSIVRTIAEAHGWDVRLADEEAGVEPTEDSRGTDDVDAERGAESRGARFEFTDVRTVRK